MRRSVGIFVGIATQLLFIATVWPLFWFLKGHSPAAAEGNLWWDVPLALQFAVVHSLLLCPWTRQRLQPYISPAFYGCFFCVATCLGLLAMFALWQPSSTSVWELHGWPRVSVQAAFALSWCGLIYSLNLNGLGYQTGWTPWWHWYRRQPLPPRRFEPRGAYLWLRHPVYLSFMGLIWFTPDMTLDRVLLTGLWTGYLFVGSALKDQRLAYYLKEAYRDYQSRVPGYPLMPWGPLARVPWPGTGARRPSIAAETGASRGSPARRWPAAKFRFFLPLR
jgi:hypothetical protein